MDSVYFGSQNYKWVNTTDGMCCLHYVVHCGGSALMVKINSLYLLL